MELSKEEFIRLLELEKTDQFLNFDIGGKRVILMTEDTLEAISPRMIDRFIH